MSDKFFVLEGKFLCKDCKIEVKTVRVYFDTGKATWMCTNKHLSEIKLFQVGYKKKRDYEREERK
jgi:hypothetical protein